MKYMLDTHAWFRTLESPHQLPALVRGELENPDNAPFGLSVISFWELAKLVEKGRIKLTVPLREWMERAADPEFIAVIPLSMEVAVDSTILPGDFHSDPADEIIIASARSMNATLITADKKILNYKHVKTLWGR